jgi:hypothetical protein
MKRHLNKCKVWRITTVLSASRLWKKEVESNRVTAQAKEFTMKRNFIIVPLLVLAFVAFQIAPPAHSEPITLTVLAIAGLTAVLVSAYVNQAEHKGVNDKALLEKGEHEIRYNMFYPFK